MKKVLCLLLLLSSVGLSAQQYLYLKKNNEIPAHRFSLKEPIRFKTIGESRWDKGLLQEINKESIKVDGVIYALSDIDAVRTNNDLVKIGGSAILVGGALFSAIAFVNRLMNGNRPLLTDRQMAWGAGLMAGGGLALWASRKTYRSEDGWKWVVIDLSENATS